MKWLFAAGLLVHGLIHLMGFAKAFGYAELPQLTQPITRGAGLSWLLAAVLFLAAVVALFAWPRGWWLIGALAVVVSQAVIVSSWRDAKYGTIPNLAVLAGVMIAFGASGPLSFRAEFEREAGARTTAAAPPALVTTADLSPLPPAIQRYLTLTGALGQPRVTNFHARFRGRIRSGPDARWMPFEAEQVNVYASHARLFVMHASMLGVPFDVFHRFADGAATMRVRLASLLPMVDAEGPEMTQAETVTLFNDMCVFAPGTLISPSVTWPERPDGQVEGAFTNAGVTVRAVLTFNEAGELVDFVSDDRLQGSSDGTSFARMRWSTPLADYRTFGAHTLSGAGVGRWHPKATEAYDYIEMSLTDIRYNLQKGER